MVFGREPEGTTKNVKEGGGVVVFTCPVDIPQMETKGTVLLRNKEELLGFTDGEEKLLEKVPTTSILTVDLTQIFTFADRQ